MGAARPRGAPRRNEPMPLELGRGSCTPDAGRTWTCLVVSQVGGGDGPERATTERVQVSVRGSRLAFMGRCHGRLKKGSHDKGSHDA